MTAPATPGDVAPVPAQPAGSGPRPLARKVGPFTLAGWGAIIGGGVVLGLVLKRTGLIKPTSPAPDLTSDTDAGSGGGYSTNSGGQVTTISNGAITQPGPPAGLADNLAWRKAALTALIGASIDAATADSALAKYLEGQPLTAQEQGIISQALVLVGSPPEGAPSITQIAAPEPAPSSNVPTSPAPAPAPLVFPTPAAADQPTAAWWNGVKSVTDAMNAGAGNASDIFPKAAYLGITTDDPNLKNVQVIGWYALWACQNGHAGNVRPPYHCP